MKNTVNTVLKVIFYAELAFELANLADAHHNTMGWDCPLVLAFQFSTQPTTCFHGHFCNVSSLACKTVLQYIENNLN